MIVVDRPDLVREVIEGLHAQYKKDKPMPHSTELIYCLTKSYLDRTQPVDPTDREVLLWVSGFGLEEVLMSGKVGEKVEPKELEGIYYSPDLFWVEESVPGEIKTTRTSSKRIVEGDYPETWIKQIKGYCYAERQSVYLLMTLCLMGNYRPPFPHLHVQELHFMAEELVANWEWLQMRRMIYMAHHSANHCPVPFHYNEDWECENCRYKLTCDVIAAQGAEEG